MPPPDEYEHALDHAASLCGIEPRFWDIWGNLHVTSPDTKRAILTAMGVAVGSAQDLSMAAEQRDRRQWTQLVAPCLVLSASHQPREFSVQVPAGEADAAAHLEIAEEGTTIHRLEISLGRYEAAATADFDGVRYVRKNLPL
ncbi:MAG: hypothetical protein ABIZ80_16025, partial [Bryobacteraceae bacterium]